MTLLPVPHRSPFFQRPHSTSHYHGSITFINYLPKPTFALSSSSSSIVEDDLPPPSDAIPVQQQSPADELPFGGCKACGREELERGCNGEGRIQGGIATVPGFGWWPIKAYRPCPGFLASGGRYRRQGQSMDEVAFGRGDRSSPTEAQSSKKKEGPRDFRR